ncbi:glutathione S-transferase family protein [Rhizobium leucaenae]|uniref:glutathione transferase n=1 Tax=Rhizobium leucaenae TaxID=29450 RepID=A0A7W6ZZK1_9HYPH|nr:glutathione S-transferase family protein [Rhizobium leucaenae]MBB4571703.1 glutathione S-transferase [Rhizobium leucaenae]MBB6305661.1 glutathione S-transferase [Rhizobium leucaenae]
MEKPCLFGADYSVYVRIARLALLEKGVEHERVPIDVFAEGGPPASYLERHPFGLIPAFEHGDFRLYETAAITRYVDEVFDGPRLQPVAPRQRARMNQIVSIADGYLYPHLVWGICVERVFKPAKGIAADEERIAASLSKAAISLAALSDLIGYTPWFCGPEQTLADLYVAPMFDYFLMAPEGREMIEHHPKLASWWSRIAVRPSVSMTNFSRPEGRHA